MSKKTVHLTFPEELIQEPVIYRIGHEFRVVTSIFLASVGEKEGWIDLGLEGDDQEIQKSIEYMKSMGIRVAEKA
ncbi:MAG: hypothetical protein AUK29_06100 [Nitrospirae bacterium CG2_30_53_67]|nr:MAG: hypothetical protein AUK29_06100 [Nitrospirae bacterium CG2_30_53_67]